MFRHVISPHIESRYRRDMASCIVSLGVALDVWSVVLVVQPDTNKEATTSERTIIAVIGFNCIMRMQEAKVGLTIPILSNRIQSRVQTCLSIIVPNTRRLRNGLKCE